MSFQFIFLLLAILNVATSQYYGSPPSPYQPYNYFPSPIPYPPLYEPYHQQYGPPGIAPTTYTPAAVASVPNPQHPYQPPSYLLPLRFTEQRSTPNLPPFTSPGMHQMSYSPIYPPMPGPTSPKYSPMSVAPKCNLPTAVAYYLTSKPETPETKVKEAKEKVTEKLRENLPTYPCPFCTGFADVPKNSKVPPPPPSSSVLPGILDKIPTIKLPEKFKIGDLSKITPPSPPFFPESFEKKLAAKLRFDEDLLDGFLTGLGLRKLQSPL